MLFKTISELDLDFDIVLKRKSHLIPESHKID